MINSTALEERLAGTGAILLDGYDAAILGVATLQDGQEVLVYDHDALVALMVAHGIDATEASESVLEFDEGEGSPVIMRRLEGTHD